MDAVERWEPETFLLRDGRKRKMHATGRASSVVLQGFLRASNVRGEEARFFAAQSASPSEWDRKGVGRQATVHRIQVDIHLNEGKEKTMKRNAFVRGVLAAWFLASTVTMALGAEIQNVSAVQRWPWNGKVDIWFDVEGELSSNPSIAVTATDSSENASYTAAGNALSGDTGYSEGRHHVVWDLDKQGVDIQSTNVVFTVTYQAHRYCVVDLSKGTNAAAYPITYMGTPPSGGFNTDNYKKTKLVLRRIEPGTFTMGSPKNELGRFSNEVQHQVTLTKPYYIGVFEVTQNQWELVKGENPSFSIGDMHPVEQVSYDDIRGSSKGAKWPTTNAVDATSFLGIMRSRTGLIFDLPTEAQWEYACRAGTTTALNSGKNLTDATNCPNLGALGRYCGNGGAGAKHAKVGSYAANTWGLYDMHGNVYESCLDRFGDYATGAVTDPKGGTTGTNRVRRGGACVDYSRSCRSAVRIAFNPALKYISQGLRLAMPSNEASEAKICSGSSEVVAVRCIGDGIAGSTAVGDAVEGIRWSGDWVSGVEGGTAVVKEAETVLMEAEGEGELTWLPLRAGTRELTHNVQGEDGTAVGETLTATFEVAKGTQTIDFLSLGTQWTTNVVELGAVARSGLPVTYEVAAGPGVVEDGVLTFTGAGTVTVTARQEGDDNWEAAEPVSVSCEVAKTGAEVVLSGLSQVYDGEAKRVGVETVPQGLNVSVTYDGTEEAPVGAGQYAVVAMVEDAIWEGRAEGVLEVSKGQQSIAFGAIGEQVATNVVELGASASSCLPVEYAVEGPALLVGNWLTFTGAGTVRVTASQAGDANWMPAESVTREISVVKATAIVTLADLARVYDGEEKAATVVVSPAGLNVVVTYDGDERVPTDAGRYAVVATVVDEKWEGSVEGTLVVSKGSQSIEFGEIGPQVATNMVELSATASSGLEVKFAVLSGPGALNGSLLSFTGAGTVTVMALQEGNANWTQATVLQSFGVVKAGAAVTLSGLEQVYDGGAKGVGVETVPEGLAVTVTYDGGEDAPVGAGSYGVVATVVDDIWAGSAEGTLVIEKGAQGIEFAEIGEQVATNVVELVVVASSGLEVGYEVEGPAVLEGNALWFTGSGTVVVTATQEGNVNWKAAEPVAVSFEVVKAGADVMLYGLLQVYDGSAKVVEVLTEPVGLSVAVTYDGALSAPTNAGDYEVVAVVEDAIWEGRAEGVLSVAKGAQSIEFAEIGGQVATNVVELGAMASSGLEVEYAVEGPGVLGIGNVLTFTGAGTVTVTATQAGDENWMEAEPVAVSFEVVKARAEVVLDGLLQVFDGGAKSVGVSTVPAGLTVAVTYAGAEGAPTNAGNYAVVAVVVDDVWEGSAEGTLEIAKGSQIIAFEAIGEQVATNVVELGAVASSGLEVEYVVEGPVVLAGSALSFTGAGTVTVTASQVGDDNWEAAEAVSVSFGVVKARAEVVLSGLEQVYDGSARVVGVATVPEGLAVAVTYEGAEGAPTNAGSYAVLAVVEEALWEGSASGTLVVEKGCQSIAFPAIGTCGAGERLDLVAEASSGLPVTFAVLSGPAVLEGGTSLRFVGTGTVAVATMQFGDANWQAADIVQQEFEVVKSRAEVALSKLEQMYDGAAKGVSVATVPEGLSVTVSYDGSEEVPVGAGRYAVVATVVDALWTGSAEGTLVVAKATVGEEPGGGEIPAGGLSVFDTTAVYDGEGHWIDTTGIETAFAEAMIGEFAVEYATGEEEPSEGWVAETPQFTNVCAQTVWYRVCSPNYEAFVHAARVTVTAADISEGEGFEVMLGASPVYDGTEQSMAVESAVWQGLPATFEVAGNSAVHAGAYTLTLEGTGNFAGVRSVEWTLLPRPVTLASASAEKVYDETPLTKDEVAVAEGSLDFVEGEGFTAVCTGSQTEAGTSDNTFDYELTEGTLEADYAITTVYGTLTVTDPIPAVSDDSEVAAALAGSADARLGEKLTTAAAYNGYRDWVAEKGLDRQAVKDSPHAWPSYLLGAAALFENEPTIQIVGFLSNESTEGSRKASASWEIRVMVKDGENAASVDADKVAALFEATRQIGDWTAPSLLPLSVTAKGTEGDTLLFDVTPAEESAPSAFFRLGE